MNRQETFIYPWTLATGLVTSRQDGVAESTGLRFWVQVAVSMKATAPWELQHLIRVPRGYFLNTYSLADSLAALLAWGFAYTAGWQLFCCFCCSMNNICFLDLGPRPERKLPDSENCIPRLSRVHFQLFCLKFVNNRSLHGCLRKHLTD